MTTAAVERRLTSRNKLENRKDEVIAAIVQHITWGQMLEMFGCSPEGLSKFQNRHRTEIDALKAEAAERAKDVLLTTKEGRIRELAWWYDQIREEAIENGIIVVEERTEGRGEDAVMYKTRDFRGQMVKEARGVIADIASELGERVSKGADLTVNIDNRRLVVHQNGAQE